MANKKTTKKKSKPKKPIGFVKQGKKFKLVFGSKTKPRFGRSTFSSKKALLKKVKSLNK